MKYIVYCTTNTVNNKIYIGVHKTQDPNKFDGYIGNHVKINAPSTYMKPTTAFQYAVKKYGVDKFSRSVLYIYDTEEEALLKEKELVTIDFIKLDTNYNMIEGGGKLRPSAPINQFDKFGNLVKHWNTTDEACDFFNCPRKSFSNAILYKELLFDYYWSREEQINIDEFSKGDPKKPVYKYLKSGKLIQVYDSLSEAAKENNTTPSTLTTAISGNALVKKEYYYSFTLYDVFVPKPKQSLKGKKLYLYKLDGTFIKEFKNSSELQEYMNKKSNNFIWDAINRRNGLYKEYQISLEYKDKLEPMVNKSKAKQVDVYTKTGDFIKTCESVQKAAKEFNANSSSINRVLRGLANTTAGYVFKFHEEN